MNGLKTKTERVEQISPRGEKRSRKGSGKVLRPWGVDRTLCHIFPLSDMSDFCRASVKTVEEEVMYRGGGNKWVILNSRPE